MSDKWITVGKTQDLIADAGVGAQVGEQQVAVFYPPDPRPLCR